MKFILPSFCLAFSLLSSCSSLQETPEGQRKPVPPMGSEGTKKPWNDVTPQEGAAMLGPLAEPRR